MDDLISRQAVLNTVFSMLCRWDTEDPDDLKDMLLLAFQELPAAQLERKWIPCSERLPGEKDSIFAGLYGTPKWNKSMFRKRSQKVLVTVVYPNGKRGVDVNHTTDGEWYKDPLSKAWDVKTVAWMPFPEPYKEEEDGTVD